MQNKIKEILHSEDPVGTKAKRWDTKVAEKIKPVTVVYMVFSAVIAIVIAALVAEYYEKNSSILLNVMGIILTLKEEAFSPFMAFVLVFGGLSLLYGVFSFVMMVLFELHGVKMEILNNSYRIMKLLETDICLRNGLECSAVNTSTVPEKSVYEQIRQVQAKVVYLDKKIYPMRPATIKNMASFGLKQGMVELEIKDDAVFEELYVGDEGILCYQGDEFISFQRSTQ